MHDGIQHFERFFVIDQVSSWFTQGDSTSHSGTTEHQIPSNPAGIGGKVKDPRQAGLPCFGIGLGAPSNHSQTKASLGPRDDRARQLADIAATGDEDSVACAAADIFREFSHLP